MSTFVITGGNSGIGPQVARNLLAHGHRVILLGRNQHKVQEALASFGDARDRAEFLSVDLSAHDGVSAAAARVAAASDRIDGLLHSAGEFVGGDVRTRDGIPLLIAVGYLSRYHLTQLLLPNLLKADHPRVVMMTAHLNDLPPLRPELFPFFEPYDLRTILSHGNAASMYYASHLSATHPTLFAGAVCPGLVRTGIFRSAPWYIRALTAYTRTTHVTSTENGTLDLEGASLSYDVQDGDGPTVVILHGVGSSRASENAAGYLD